MAALPTTGTAFGQPIAMILTDRWGCLLDETTADADFDAVGRLAGLLESYREFAFVARGVEGGYGLLIEVEVPWNQSDDTDDAIEDYWGGKRSDDEQISAAFDYSRRLAGAYPGLVPAVVSGDDVFFGRLGVQVFVPEARAADAAGAVLAAIHAGIPAAG